MISRLTRVSRALNELGHWTTEEAWYAYELIDEYDHGVKIQVFMRCRECNAKTGRMRIRTVGHMFSAVESYGEFTPEGKYNCTTSRGPFIGPISDGDRVEGVAGVE